MQLFNLCSQVMLQDGSTFVEAGARRGPLRDATTRSEATADAAPVTDQAQPLLSPHMLVSRARLQEPAAPIALWQARIREARSTEAARASSADTARAKVSEDSLRARRPRALRSSSDGGLAGALMKGAAGGAGAVAAPSTAATSSCMRHSADAGSPCAALASTATRYSQPSPANGVSGVGASPDACQREAAPFLFADRQPQPAVQSPSGDPDSAVVPVDIDGQLACWPGSSNVSRNAASAPHGSADDASAAGGSDGAGIDVSLPATPRRQEHTVARGSDISTAASLTCDSTLGPSGSPQS